MGGVEWCSSGICVCYAVIYPSPVATQRVKDDDDGDACYKMRIKCRAKHFIFNLIISLFCISFSTLEKVQHLRVVSFLKFVL